MRSEGGRTEGHAALLKLHKGAHLGRTGHAASGTKIIHSHASHTRTNKTESTTVTRCQSKRPPPKLQKTSSRSTLVWYPGMASSDDDSIGAKLNKDAVSNKVVINDSVEKTVPCSTPPVNIDERTVRCSTPPIKTNDDASNSVNTNVNLGARKRSNGYGYRIPLENLKQNTTKEFDFDFDDDEEREEAEKARSLQAQQTENYNKMCAIEGITPCGRFKRQMQDTVADVSNSYLGCKDIKSICVSLASNVTIQELNLSCNDLSAKGAIYLAEALRENISVEDLSLCQCNIDLEGLKAIADVFLDMKPMKRLDLSKNKFERRHAEIVAEIIQKNDYIEELVLSGNKFDDVGGVSLGKALASNVGIKRLDLSWNHLRRDGAKAVCMALKVNTTLEELDLSWNGLAGDGCKALGVALPCNHTLRELDISCNRISIVCLQELLKGLVKNDHLSTLRIDQNPMTTEGAIALIKCLQKSTVSNITELFMTDIPINPEFLDLLDELQKVRTVRVYHSDPHKKKITPIIRQRTLKDYDPAMILFEYMKQENLRLIDLFRTFDTDSSQSVSKEELKEGFVTINMPLTEEALDSLFERLDLNDNNEIEYDEYKVSYRKTMKKMRNSLSSDDHNDVSAVSQLKSLVTRALEDRRQEKLLQLKGMRRQRQASLTAVFKVDSVNKFIQSLSSHTE